MIERLVSLVVEVQTGMDGGMCMRKKECVSVWVSE